MKKSNIVSVIVLLGSAGVGKGTLMDGALVGREAQFNAIATGNIIRSEVTAQTPLGQKAQTFMEAGLLVPDELINNMVIQAIKDSDKPVILDGFPRNLTQCQAMLDAGIIPTKVIFVQLDDEIIIKRLAKRVICKSCGKSYSLDGPSALRSMASVTSVEVLFTVVKMTIPKSSLTGWKVFVKTLHRYRLSCPLPMCPFSL